MLQIGNKKSHSALSAKAEIEAVPELDIIIFRYLTKSKKPAAMVKSGDDLKLVFLRYYRHEASREKELAEWIEKEIKARLRTMYAGPYDCQVLRWASHSVHPRVIAQCLPSIYQNWRQLR